MTSTASPLACTGPAEFVAALDGIFEHSPWVAERAWRYRPFADAEALFRALLDTVREAEPGRRMDLIRAHPELAGRAAVAGRLTAESTAEQRGAGLAACTPDEFDALRRLNADYRAKFGFPFIIAVKGLTPADVLAAMRVRLGHDRPAEIDEALSQIAKIARFRFEARFSL
jgi:2-oxo-4-hydroxy-4-carboxy-5-ureidoimidazoline decarboxylase